MPRARAVTISKCSFVCVLVLLVLAAASSAAAQSYLFGSAQFTTGNSGNMPGYVTSGDFNGDGRLDLVVASASDPTVSILLGQPDGTFSPAQTFTVGPAPIWAVTADFNGDGILDIAVLVANCTWDRLGETCRNGWVSLLLGRGDGTFLPAVNYAVGSVTAPPVASLVVGDFNGDGLPDLACSNSTDRTVSVLLNNGVGGFLDQAVYQVPNGASSVALGDFNGDHKLDIAVTGGTMSVLLGNGDGTFQPPITSGTGGAQLAVGDFNHDGKLDVATTGTIMLGNGDGTFTPIQTIALGTDIQVLDFDKDGKPDLVSFNANGGALPGMSVAFGNGDGTFRAPKGYNTAGGSAGVIADINGDGYFDVLAMVNGTNGLPYSQGIVVSLGLPGPSFPSPTDYGNAEATVVTADFNGDGKLDLAGVSNDRVCAVLNNGTGTFGSAHCTAFGNEGSQLIAGDFNNDGRQDVATLFPNCNQGCLPGSAAVMLGNGDGTFQAPITSTVGLDPTAFGSGDFNNDGNLDLAVINQQANSISVLLGNGDGTFRTHVDYSTPIGPSVIVTGDVNGDGIPDIVVSGSGTVYFPGRGDGTFGPAATISTSYSGPIAIGDLNGDGIPDLVVGDWIFLGVGNGNFQQPMQVQTYGTLAALIDLNRDGKLDILTYGSYAYVGLGNGDATFQPQTAIPASGGLIYGITAADLNGDGALDLASAPGNNNRISVLLSAPFKAIAPTALNFGSQGTGTQSPPRTLTITNISNVKFNLVHIATIGSFGQSNDCPATLDPGGYCTVSVTFSPHATGELSGLLTIADSTPSSPTAVSLTGVGVSGPYLSPTPASLSFAALSVGNSSSPLAILLENTGNATLTISSIGTGGTNGSDFSQTNNCPASLPVGGSCIANVTFTPTAGGTRVGFLTISDNASGSPQNLPLRGVGLAENNTLTVTVNGSGGNVTSGDGFIHCPGTCSHDYPANTQVTLNAGTDQYWFFSGWDGNCSGLQSCTLNMTQNMSAIANFAPSLNGYAFVPITPCRAVDTRGPDGSYGGPALQGGQVRVFEFGPFMCNLPETVGALVWNLTVIPHGQPLGYLTVWPSNQNQPNVSTMNSPDGRTKANASIVPASDMYDPQVSVYVTNTTDFIMDLMGYFQNGGGSRIIPLPPCRLVDTRGAAGQLGGPYLSGGVERDFPLLASDCIPAGANVQAYSLNITVLPHTAGQPLRYLTVWPAGQAQPGTSLLNNPTATFVANAALVQAGTNGSLAVYPSDDTDLLVDINGYFSNSDPGALLFYPLAPCRVLDTRQGSGAFSGELSPPVDVEDNPCGAGPTAQAYVFNATVVPSGHLGYLTLWADGQGQPGTSTLNAIDGLVTSNMAVVPTANGSIDAYASALTQLILDISGYFAP